MTPSNGVMLLDNKDKGERDGTYSNFALSLDVFTKTEGFNSRSLAPSVGHN